MIERELVIGSKWRHYKQVDPKNDYKILGINEPNLIVIEYTDNDLKYLYSITDIHSSFEFKVYYFYGNLVIKNCNNEIVREHYVIYKKESDKIPYGRRKSEFLGLNDNGDYRFTRIS